MEVSEESGKSKVNTNRYKTIFEIFDRKGEGKFTFNDFNETLQNFFELRLTEEDAKVMFKTFGGSDSTGVITLADFGERLNKCACDMAKVDEKEDRTRTRSFVVNTNGDGEFGFETWDEDFEKFKKKLQHVKQMINSAGLDLDKEILDQSDLENKQNKNKPGNKNSTKEEEEAAVYEDEVFRNALNALQEDLSDDDEDDGDEDDDDDDDIQFVDDLEETEDDDDDDENDDDDDDDEEDDEESEEEQKDGIETKEKNQST